MDSAPFSELQTPTAVSRVRRQDVTGRWLVDRVAPPGREGDDARRRLRNHYVVTLGLDLPGIARPVGLVETSVGLVLTLPWLPGSDLAALVAARLAGTASIDAMLGAAPSLAATAAWPPLPGEPVSAPPVASPALLPLVATLGIGERLAAILAGLADQGVVHGQLDAGRVLVDADGTVSLLNFGRARFARAAPIDRGAAPQEHADDLRALGRLLCWLISGTRLPVPDGGEPALVDDDTRQALRGSGAPDAVRELVYRLLAAGGADGYRHARRAQADLARCRAENGPLSVSLGAPPDLCVPVQRFGRESELSVLVAAYSTLAVSSAAAGRAPSAEPDGRRAGAPVLVWVDGPAGIGKSAVIDDACRAMARHGARIASGKFNQFGDSRPLWALTQALDGLVRTIVADGGHRHAAQVRRLREALLDLAQVMVDAVPHLGRLLGPQPEPPQLSGEASRLRFELLMCRFVAALSTRDEPLVLVLDDMHWADPVSLAMLRSLLRDPESRHLLLIAAYRSEAVPEGHPLRETIAAIRSDGVDVRAVTVPAWSRDDVAQLVAGAGLRDADGAPVAGRPAGRHQPRNPLAVLQALRELHDGGALRHDEARGVWQVDAARAQAALEGAPSLELARRQLVRLPVDARHAVSTGAFLGASFTAHTLAAVMGLGHQQALSTLWLALARAGRARPGPGAGPAATRLRMAHDIVQQAAHGLVGDGSDADRHGEIGRALLAAYNASDTLQEHMFEVVLHFNQAGAGAIGAADRAGVIGLNVAAGRQARGSGAAGAALAHFSHALALLDDNDWAREPLAVFDTAWNAGEAAYLVADFDRLDQITALLLRRAPDPVAQARALELCIQGLLARNRLGEALHTGEQALSLLGVRLEPLIDPAAWPAVPELPSLALDAPRDPRVDAALRVLVWLTPCAYITSFETYARVILTMIGLARAHPSSPLTAISFTNYGLTLCGIGRSGEGFAAGELALALSEQVRDDALRCKVHTLTHGFLRHWRLPAAAALQPLLDTVQACLRCGDQEYVGYASFLYCDKAWGVQPLAELERVHARHTAMVQQFGHEFSWRHCLVWLQFQRALLGRADEPLLLRGDAFDERGDLARLETADNRFSLFTAHVLRGFLAWHRGDTAAARSACRDAGGLAMSAAATLLSVDHAMLWALCELRELHELHELRELREPRASGKADAATRVDELLARLRAWAEAAPANVAHKLALVEAERLRLAGDTVGAWQGYERAATLAAAAGFEHDQALIAELSGEFLSALGQPRAALDALHRAYGGYLAWGAVAVAQSLLARHPELEADEGPVGGLPRAIGLNLRDKLSALLHEFGLDRVIVLVDGAPTALVSDRLPEVGSMLVRAPVAGAAAAAFPLMLFERARQAGRYIACSRPADDPAWLADPYVAARRPGSAAVWPVLRGARTIGAVWLESEGRRLLSPRYLGERLAWHVQAIVDEIRAEQLADQLQESARLDPLTRLPNRGAFVKIVDLTLARMRSLGERGTAVAVVTLRHFDERVILDTRDHGDAVLLELTGRLTGTAKAAGVVASLSRNRFGLLYWGLSAEAVLSDCRRLRSVLDGRYAGDLSIVIETDIAVRIDDGRLNGAAALRDAEGTLAPAPSDGSGDVILFDAERHQGDTSRHGADAVLRQEARLRADAEERSREKSRFIATAVHDLKQPLQAIGNSLEPAWLALRSGDAALAEQLIGIARRATTLMRDQLGAILDISRLESGLAQANYSDFELGPLLQSVFEQVEAQAASHGVSVGWSIEPEGRVFVRSDRQLLRRLLLNLLHNSVKYRSARADEPPFVHLLVRPAATRVEIVVHDNGIGIAQELIDSGAIFRPFFQAERGHHESERGVGLGLAIVKVILGLMPDHGLTLSSQLGVGTRFMLTAPVSTLGAVVDEVQSSPNLDLRGIDLSSYYVLLVEDDDMVMQSTGALLEAFGALHERAMSIEELQRVLREMEREPDVVLTDYLLPPRHSALDVIDCVTRQFGPVPTIVFTGETLDPGPLSPLSRYPLLRKPLEPLELLRCVVKATAGRRVASASPTTSD